MKEGKDGERKKEERECLLGFPFFIPGNTVLKEIYAFIICLIKIRYNFIKLHNLID